MTAAMIVPPVGIAFIDFTILSNPYVWLVFAGVILFFGTIEYFFCIRPFLIYRSLPDVLAETDGEYLYFSAPTLKGLQLSRVSADSLLNREVKFEDIHRYALADRLAEQESRIALADRLAEQESRIARLEGYECAKLHKG